jgi:hypothetical protein
MLKRGLFLSALLSLTLVACPQPVEPPTPAKPSIGSFSATPAALLGGGSSKLQWQVSGADSISIDNGVGIVTGNTRDVDLTATTMYTLTATNAQGSVTQTTTVTVTPLASQDLTKLSGTVAPWTRGVRKLVASGYVLGETRTLLEGDLQADGAFEVTLATPANNFLLPTTFGPGCTEGIVSAPLNLKGVGVTSFSVVTSSGLPSGSLIHSNTAGAAFGLPAAGSRFVFYAYVDQNGTIKGTCSNPNGAGSITVDMKLRQGWNATLVEYSSPVDVRYVTAPIPTDLAWRFIPASGGTLTITNPVTSLEIGKSLQLNVVAKEPDGTLMTNPELVWTSTTPSIIEVTPTGVITAKALGYAGAASISVALKNMPGTGASLYNISTFGLEAAGGTFNLEDQSLGTAVRLRYQAANFGASPASVGFTITGPSGWNNNQPFTGSFAPSSNLLGVLSEIAAVNGTYQIQTNTVTPTASSRTDASAGWIFPRTALTYPISQPAPSSLLRPQSTETASTTFMIDTSKKLPTVSNFRMTGFQNTNPTLAWTNIPNFDLSGANSRMLIEVKDETANQVVLANQPLYFYNGNYTISGLTFDTTHTYRVSLTAIQGSSTGEVTVSRTSTTLDFRPEITELSASGGAKGGNYNLTITGYNFDINTSVFFGTTEATSKTLQGSSSVQVVVPAGVVGTVDVRVTNTRGSSTMSALTKFKYYDIQEFDVVQPTKLLASTDGTVYFIEYNWNRTPPVTLSKITEAGTITRVDLNNVYSSYYLRDLAMDSTGNVWVALENKLLRVSPTGTVDEITLPSGVSPQMIAFGSDGNLWIAHNDNGSRITRIQPDGSNASAFVLAGGSSSFSSGNEMLLGPDNNLWFTTSGGYGRITPGGSITILSTGYYSATTMILSDGALWVNGSYSASLLQVDVNGTTTPYTNTCTTSRFARGSDNAFWCLGGYYGSGDLLRRSVLNGSSGSNEGIALPSSGGYSNGISDLVSSSTGKIWYLRNNKIGLVTP